ncbi:ROK family protein [Butyrivibrio sp. XB500-5]|uniref:ROK family protein n=1 Tax=Butyrivibrio sp. XB500-5 TaxID=2364880 RepID=UPI000EAA1164|nr:ROK family protein [Butyrivibrio sp. XB500-5]RKM57773.1 ROK family protein [Butyrivibrio sp. XB500-5]
MLYGGIEAGGTKMICVIGNENGEILERVTIPTKSPEETIPDMIDFFRGKDIKSLGIGCFGPIDLNIESKTYGYITSTPKLEWRNFDIVGAFKKELNIPIGFDTDVNASLLGEITWGCAKNKQNALYLTIGTGIGGGVMTNGKLLHGMLHPELGHIKMQPAPGDDYKGKCPYHGTCFEGMAAGPAIEDRWGKKGYDLADKEEVWELESYYIAQALCDFIVTLSPEIIILGGGVMNQEQLFPLIREKTLKQLAGYINTKELEDIDNYIVPASLNGDQGIMGAVKLAIDVL